MANIAKMEAAGATAKPTIKATLTAGKDGLTIHIPGVVDAESIREKHNEESGKTNFTVVALTYGSDGKAAPPVTLKVKEGEVVRDAQFGLSTINLQFRGFVKPTAS